MLKVSVWIIFIVCFMGKLNWGLEMVVEITSFIVIECDDVLLYMGLDIIKMK